MKIIFLTANYFPDIAANVHLAKDLVEDLAIHGCRVIVITQRPNRFIDENNRSNYVYKKKETLLNNNVEIHRVNMLANTRKSLIHRALKELLLTLKLFISALLVTKADAIFVYSTPPTLGLIGIILSKIKKIPIIYNLQDIFPDSLINAGIIRNGIILKIGKIIEKSIYKNSTRIAVISEDFKKIIMNRGVSSEKIDIVYNWIDADIVRPVSRKENSIISRYNLDDKKFYITYCGNIGLTQNLELLVDVAKYLESYEEISFVVIGDGAHKEKLMEYSVLSDIRNVVFLPFQPYENISDVYSLGDVGLIISKKNIGKNSFPSKTWSIMSAERAVLASFDEESELCSIINSARCGICVPPENKAALKDAILKLYKSRELTKEKGYNGRKYILEQLNRKDNTEKMYRNISNLC